MLIFLFVIRKSAFILCEFTCKILGVSTDDNGLFYMRQRYYNPEIKRFINQDILAGTLDNSQSLNRYCYVQGNPVSYVDPFGLSPMSGQSGTNFAHTVLGFLSCIPGPFGMLASAIDAGVYAFVDKDYAMAALCMVDVVTFGMGKVATGMIKAGKMTKTGVALLKTSSMISNTVNFAVNVNAGANMAYGMYDKYIVQGHEFDSSTGWEILGLGLSVIGGVSSARGMTRDARHLGNLFSDADFTGGMKQELTQFASGVKDFYNNHKLNNRGFVDLSCFGFKGGSNTFGRYQFKKGIDIDLRGKGTYKDALDMAFEKTGVSKDKFNVTKWGKDKNGKSFPVEWRADGGAEVNIDIGHSLEGEAPTVPHVGWQTGGKRGSGGAVRGHIFVDDVPYNR